MTRRPPNVLVEIRRGETLLRWILAGLIIGLAAGTLFGVVAVVATESPGAFWFGGFMGANFGVAAGAPFGLVLGIFNALLPSPSRVRRLILTARIAGTAVMLGAGIWLASVADDIFLLAAVIGAAIGWAFTPTVVWSSVEPLPEPSVGAATLTSRETTP